MLSTASLFRNIADMANIGILVLDDKNRIEFANRMLSHFLGYEFEKLAGKNFTEFLDEKHRRIFQTFKEDSNIQTRTHPGMEILTANSTSVIAEMCFTRYSTQSEEKKYFIYLRDISVQWHLSRELRESEKRYRELFNRVDQGIFISTKEGRFVDCNAALLNL